MKNTMFWMDKSTVPPDDVPSSTGLSPDVIVCPDTLRAKRLPPGQIRTKQWPVLDASGPPSVDLARWRLRLSGLVTHELVCARPRGPCRAVSRTPRRAFRNLVEFANPDLQVAAAGRPTQRR